MVAVGKVVEDKRVVGPDGAKASFKDIVPAIVFLVHAGLVVTFAIQYWLDVENITLPPWFLDAHFTYEQEVRTLFAAAGIALTSARWLARSCVPVLLARA